MTETAALFLLFRATPENFLRLQRLAATGDQVLVLGAAVPLLAEHGRGLLPALADVCVGVLNAHWLDCGLEIAALPPDIESVDYTAMVRKVESCRVCHSLG